MPQETTSKLHIQSLDVMRGIAASFVIVHHVFRTTPGLDSSELLRSGPVPLWMRHIFLGDLAVILFFVLSGASLAISTLDKPEPLNLWRFWVKRFFRIYPLYFLCIMVYFLFRPVYSGYMNAGLVAPDLWLTKQFTLPTPPLVWFAHLTMTINWLDVPVNFNNVLWSLVIEIQFYLLFPVMIFFFTWGRKRGALLIVAFSGLLYLLNYLAIVNVNVFERSWEFAAGVIIGAYWKEIAAFTQRRHMHLALSIAALVLFEMGRAGLTYKYLPINFFDGLFCMIIVLIGLSRWQWRANSTLGRFFLNVGTWSFSLYLVHNLLLGFLTPLIRTLQLPPILYFVVTFPLIFGLALFASKLLYEHFERPFMQLGRRLTDVKPITKTTFVSSND